MKNLISIYESFNEACLPYGGQAKCRTNKLSLCIKEGVLFKGFKVSYLDPESFLLKTGRNLIYKCKNK
jgi:hypothetical protein